jgi:transposase InsO family protein
MASMIVTFPTVWAHLIGQLLYYVGGDRRRPGAGLIHHSDRGSQYAASQYRDILQAAAITQSMSRKANCWDNAPMESFFGTLKTELVHHGEYPDRNTARPNCSLISKAITIVRRSTPPSATSPHSRQRQKPHNPVSTFPGEGQEIILGVKAATQCGVSSAANLPIVDSFSDC